MECVKQTHLNLCYLKKGDFLKLLVKSIGVILNADVDVNLPASLPDSFPNNKEM